MLGPLHALDSGDKPGTDLFFQLQYQPTCIRQPGMVSADNQLQCNRTVVKPVHGLDSCDKPGIDLILGIPESERIILR